MGLQKVTSHHLVTMTSEKPVSNMFEADAIGGLQLYLPPTTQHLLDFDGI